MIYSRTETIQIIDKLIELTQHRMLLWQEGPLNDYMNGPDEMVEIVYVTEHLGRIIRAYRRDFKYFYDEMNFSWDYEIIIEFTNNYGHRLGRFQKTPNASELLQAIQYQNPNVRNFFNEIFN
ncbi:hypothetical protein ACET5Z_17995 [Aeromonas veronii]